MNSKPIFYIANSIYQFAYALPIYRQLGGIFVVNSAKKLRHFKKHFKDWACHEEQNSDGTPNVILMDRSEYQHLKGVLLFLANSITPEHTYQDAICLFHEHGTSDKLYEGGAEIGVRKLNKYDYILLSGPKNLERLREIGADLSASRMVASGPLRFDDYLHGAFDRQKELINLGIKDTTRKNVLYAPTWRFGDGTMRKYFIPFAKALTKEYNLILRPHYHDRKEALVLYWITKLMGMSHVYYSNAADIRNRDTYADFVLSDLLISDMSSVVYEYLITEKPMIIIENHFKARHQMPAHWSAGSVAAIFNERKCIATLVQLAFENAEESAERYRTLLNHCFYRPQGGAVAFTVDFIKSL